MNILIFILKRLVKAGATLIVLSFVIFTLLFFVSEETIFFEQYSHFVSGIFHLDFGTSIVTGHNVLEYISPFATFTLSMLGFVILLYIIFRLALGMIFQTYKTKNDFDTDCAVLFMKARSLSRLQIMLAGLKNAFPDTLRQVSILVPSFFGVIAIIEIVFSMPGLGYLLVSQVILGDIPVIRFILLMVVAIICIAMALLDILLYLFSPNPNYSEHTLPVSPQYIRGNILFLLVLIVFLFIGVRGAMIAPLCIAFVSLIIGLTLGCMAAWFGGWIDRIISAYTYIFISIPAVLFAIAITGLFGGGYLLKIVLVILLFFPSDTRLVRKAFARQKQMPYITSVLQTEIKSSRIILKHIFPNIYKDLFLRLFRNVIYALILISLLSAIMGDL